MARAKGGHVLATVVFTDIVESSHLAAELGDRRWRVLLGRHHSIIRKALKRHDGREIDDAGDGFLITFDDQADAIRFACEISDEVRGLGLEIRAGCHVGQAEVMGRKLGGVTVHAGARVMSEAGPGEVLVSGVMRDLVPASGFTFADRGLHHLKGIEGEWRLFAVTAVDGKPRPSPSPPEVAAVIRQAIEPPPLMQRRTGRVAIASVAILILVGLGVGFARRPHPVVIQPNSLVRIDSRSNKIVADAALAIHPGTSQLTFVPPNQIWVMSQQDQVIAVVDINTNAEVRVRTTSFGGQTTSATRTVDGEGIVYAYGSVWASGAQQKINQLDPVDGGLVAPVPVPGNTDLLVEGLGSVWVMSWDIDEVFAVDPKSGQVTLHAPIGGDASGMAVGEGAVWVSSWADGIVSKIDPRSGVATPIHIQFRGIVNGTVEPTRARPSGVGTGFSSVWVTDTPHGVLYRVDPATLQVLDTIRIGQPKGPPFISLSTIVAADGSLWVASPASKTVVRIDPDTDRVISTVQLPYTPRSLLATADGSVWVTVEGQ